MKIFVYGSLMKGFHNHFLLEDATFIKNDSINARLFTGNWHFPFITLDNAMDYKVHGEIYDVDSLQSLDYLESYQGPEYEETNFYNRRQIHTNSVERVWVYEAGNHLRQISCMWIIGGQWGIEQSIEKFSILLERCNHVPRIYSLNPQYFDILLENIKCNVPVSVSVHSYRAMKYAAEKHNIKVSFKASFDDYRILAWYSVSIKQDYVPALLKAIEQWWSVNNRDEEPEFIKIAKEMRKLCGTR
jgi:gamma-glutamylcyclotransferase (GGCT)/AIG2-like uncharacterized protein YtfP